MIDMQDDGKDDYIRYEQTHSTDGNETNAKVVNVGQNDYGESEKVDAMTGASLSVKHVIEGVRYDWYRGRFCVPIRMRLSPKYH